MLAKFSVKKPMTVLVCVILVLILGVVSFLKMTPDLLPNISLPYVLVLTSCPGESPEEIETIVTKPIEQSVATLDHIKNIQSVSSENISMVIMEFAEDADMDAVSMNIREKLNLLESAWDDTVGTPTILKLNPNMIPLSVYTVSREGQDAVALTEFYEETLGARLEGVEGVASVTPAGDIRETVRIQLHENKIDQVNKQIAAAIDREFADGEKKIADSKEDLKEAWEQVEEGQADLEKAQKELRTAKRDIEKEFDSAEKKLKEQLAQVENGKTLLVQMIGNIEKLARDGNPMSDAQIAQLPNMYAELSQVESAITQLESAIAALPEQEKQAIRSLYGADDRLEEGMEQLEDTRTQLTDSEKTLADSEEQLADSKTAALEGTNMNNLLTVSTVSGILTAQNFSMPAGYARDEKTDCLIYVGDKLTDAEELKELILFDLGLEGMEPIRLKDVADVLVTDNSNETYARINGSAALALSFYKQSGYATAEVSDRLEETFATLSEQYPGLVFSPMMDQGDYIHLVVGSVLENLILGGVLAVLILLLFLRDLRPTFVVACSIPISVTFAIVLMYFSGVTLNIISMSGLAVGVGMLVDNSIVVIENIYRLRKEGVPVLRACVSGAAQVAGAITASTITTVCVFVPIVFVEGMTRQLFMDMALTIGYSLLASLVVALTLVPALSSGMLRRVREKEGRFTKAFQKVYRKSLNFVLRFRVPAFILSIVLLVVSAGAALSKGFSYMPAMESNQITVSLSMTEEGADLSDTAAVTDRIAARIKLMPQVQTVGAMTSGGTASLMGMSGGSSTTSTTVYVTLFEDRMEESSQVLKEIETICDEEPVDYTVSGGDTMGDMTAAMGGSGLVLYVYGQDTEDMQTAAREAAARLEQVEGLVNISDGLEETEPALRITVKKDRAMEEGLTVAQVYQYIAQFLQTDGNVATLDKVGQDVILEAAKSAPSVKEVREKELTFADQKGVYHTVKLADIADFTETETLSSINRIGQRRYITVSAGVAEGYNVTLLTAEAQRVMADYDAPQGCSLEFAGENQTIMEAMKDLALMLLLGIVIVYLVMVAQFQSLVSPLIVMATIPLAFTGGLLALLLCGMDVSIIAMIGFVMLVGIIVNNGIVLIDAMNQLRMEGKSRREAVVEASVMRLRPVLMTALTTVLGLVPLGLAQGMGASMVQPLAVVSIGGLVYATLMTLYIVPALYDLTIRKKPRMVAKEDLEVLEA